jgi:hypothetical protein
MLLIDPAMLSEFGPWVHLTRYSKDLLKYAYLPCLNGDLKLPFNVIFRPIGAMLCCKIEEHIQRR